jgi:hypothetical protein
VHKKLGWKLQRKRTVGRLRDRQEDNIKVDHREVLCEGVN